MAHITCYKARVLVRRVSEGQLELLVYPSMISAGKDYSSLWGNIPGRLLALEDQEEWKVGGGVGD